MKYLRGLFLFAMTFSLFSCTPNNSKEEIDEEREQETEYEDECWDQAACSLLPDPQEIALDFDSTQW